MGIRMEKVTKVQSLPELTVVTIQSLEIMEEVTPLEMILQEGEGDWEEGILEIPEMIVKIMH